MQRRSSVLRRSTIRSTVFRSTLCRPTIFDVAIRATALALAFAFTAMLTGCLGKNTPNGGNGGVSSVTLSPTGNVSIEIGSAQFFSASARNGVGQPVAGVDIQYLVTSGTPNNPSPLSIASNGNACAGTWNSTASICSPGNDGIALVTAVANGVSSPVATVYVHRHIDNIQIAQAESQPPNYDCFSQGQTWMFQARAFNNNVDITSTVGYMSWSYNNTGVLTTNTTISTLNPNEVQVTAKSPGITQLYASVSGTISGPYLFSTCLVRYIRLQVQGSQLDSTTVTNGAGIPLTATAIDSLGFVIPAPPLTWSTTNPEVAAFTTVTNSTGLNNATARNNNGGATLFASCTPPSCNIGIAGYSANGDILPGLPIYSSDGPLPNGSKGFGAITVDVTLPSTGKEPTYSAYAATTGCANAVGCTSSLFAVNPQTGSGNPIGAILALPRTPNSMVFNHLSSARLYIGSDDGLMYTDAGGTAPSVSLVSQSSTPCNVALCGKVLTISNDGKLVVVADTVSTPSQVYVYNGGSSSAAPVDLIIPGETPTAAAFSPDQLKLFILTSSGNLYVYSTVDALSSVPIADSASDIAFSADGSLAFILGSPTGSISAYSTCALPGTPTVNLGSSVASGTMIFPSPQILANGPQLTSGGPNGNANSPSLVQPILVLNPSVPSVEILDAEYTQQPVAVLTQPSPLTCNPPVVSSPLLTPVHTFAIPEAPFTPLLAQLVNDGTQLLIVAKNIPAVLLFNVADGSTSAVELSNSNSNPLSAATSTDGSQVFVAACDQYDQDGVTCAVGSIHVVNTTGINGVYGDYEQVQYVNSGGNRNMCNNGGNPAPQCLPNLVALKPQ